MCIIPAVCYVYGGVIEGWSDLQASGSSGLLTQIPFYQILMLVPLILLLMIRWKPWCIWLLKGLEIIAILIPFAMAWLQLQDALLELQLEGYLTDAVKQTRWMHFLMNEAVFYAGMICMTLSLRYLPPQEPVEDTEADKETCRDRIGSNSRCRTVARSTDSAANAGRTIPTAACSRILRTA